MSPNAEIVVLTPVVHNETHNIFRIDRMNLANGEAPGDVLLVAGGQHSGIVVRKMQRQPMDVPIQHGQFLTLDFNVFLTDSSTSCIKQENRILKFYYDSKMSDFEQHSLTQEFFKCLLNDFPRGVFLYKNGDFLDYLNFVKKLLTLIKTKFDHLKTLEVDMKLLDEMAVLPQVAELDASQEILVARAEHVREALEHAYPNGMLAENLANALQCSLEEIFEYLQELKSKNLVTQLESGQWIRADASHDFEKSIVKQMPKVRTVDQPTIAIITAFYVEKLAVDAILENKKTFVRYKTDGESNIYTLGSIGEHKVVCTKLSAVGCTRSALIAAGSVTTRLLGCFQDIQHVLVVGIGGGVPHFTDKNEHVRLGDVILSFPSQIESLRQKLSYIFCEPLQCDTSVNSVKTGGYVIRGWASTDAAILDASVELKTQVESDCCQIWQDAKTDARRRLDHPSSADAEEATTARLTFDRPSPDSDLLTVALGDDTVATVSHPDQHRAFSRLHLGVVGCGRPARDLECRGDFAHKFKIKSFDVDYQTVIESILGNRINSWTLIRGVCDYGDGSKNKEWQAFAALQAAVVAKLLVGKLPIVPVDYNGEMEVSGEN